MTNTVTEMCPFCSYEVSLEWDTPKYGLGVFCPFYGNKMLLCGECTENCNWNSENACNNANHLVEMQFNFLSDEDEQIVCFRLSNGSTVEQLKAAISKHLKEFCQDTFNGSEIMGSFEKLLDCAAKEINAEYYLKEVKMQSFDLWN